MGGGTKLSEEAHLTGSIRAFVANQVNVAISRFLGLKCASNILRFDSNVPPQCASSMQSLIMSQIRQIYLCKISGGLG